jgi:hypothetical protein
MTKIIATTATPLKSIPLQPFDATQEDSAKMKCLHLKGHCPWMRQLVISLKQSPQFSVHYLRTVETLRNRIKKRGKGYFVFIDADDPLMDPKTLILTIKEHTPFTTIIVFFSEPNRSTFYQYLLAGMDGAISKQHKPLEIRKWLHPKQPEKTLLSPVFSKMLLELIHQKQQFLVSSFSL